MRIGIDARELCGRPTGVGRYLRGLLSAWTADGSDRRHEFILYSHEQSGDALNSRRLTTRLVPGHSSTWWEQVRLPRAAARDQLDVFFSPGYTTPLLLQVPTVVAIHDLSFAAHPEWFGAREGLRRRSLTRQSARRARTVITISDFSRGELIERFGVDASRIRVVPPGVTPPLPGAQRAAGRDVLYVGSIFNRRRLPDLIKAFAGFARRVDDVTLNIVGDNRSYPRQDLPAMIEREGMTGRVRWRSYVPDAELAQLYAQAGAFAFLSEYEGLGLTPLEALAAGVPSVLLDTPVARESCQAAALYVPAGDIPALTYAIERLLSDTALRKQLLTAAPSVLDRYRWPAAGAETLRVIESAAE